MQQVEATQGIARWGGNNKTRNKKQKKKPKGEKKTKKK
jgi:hypothetical protein